MLRKVLGSGAVAIVLGVVLLSGVVGMRSARLVPAALEPVVPADFAVDVDRAAANLAAAVRFRTVSTGEDDGAHGAEFVALRAFLEEAYPAVHGALERELVGGHTLLYRWAGTELALPPILLMGHTDVVPVEEGTESGWRYGAFDGIVAEGHVWGRGTLDNKQNVIGLLEAAEQLLAEGFQPARTVYLLFGHDEEVGGEAGAAVAAALLAERGVRFAFVLDEGGMILDPTVFGSARPVALVKTAEKGYLTLELVVRGEGGHSSRPPPATPIGILSRALVRLEASPFPARLEGAALELVRGHAAELGGLPRLALANRWLLERPLLRTLARDPTTNASIRTTIAPTMLRGSPKDNVLPARASAVVNLRLLPGDSVAGAVAHVRRAIGDDRVEVLVRQGIEPSPTSEPASPNFALLARTIRQVAPEARVSPYLALGATDSRHFTGLSDDVYGFTPVLSDADVLTRVHGTDERIAIADVERLLRFYVQLLRSAAGEAAAGAGR
jgi:carboxypeptidase PM20D1